MWSMILGDVAAAILAMAGALVWGPARATDASKWYALAAALMMAALATAVAGVWFA